MHYKMVQKGNFKRIERFLNYAKGRKYLNTLDTIGKKGVDALKDATPKDTGTTANSWSYEIFQDDNLGRVSIVWTNDNMTKYNIPVALLIQYGHATRNGGWVEGIDYINPTLRPLFEEMAKKVWKEITNV